MSRLLKASLLLWLLGIALSVAIAIALAVWAHPDGGTTESMQAAQGEEAQTITLQRSVGTTRLTFARQFGAAWSPMQAAGAPNTHGLGDIPTAWASLSPDEQREWLELDYAERIHPKSVVVFESNSPGALTRLTAFGGDGIEIELWSGDDPSTPNSEGVSVATISVSKYVVTSRIRLYLDSPKVRGWNEIDAVGLIDEMGQTHWACGAHASSTYAQSPPASTYTFAQLRKFTPAWFKLPTPARDNEVPEPWNGIVDARGWPMLALWADGKLDAPLQATKLHHPIWAGLLIDGAFWAVPLALLYLATFSLRRFIVESRRLRRGCCMKCGYDLRWEIARGCPECGWRRT